MNENKIFNQYQLNQLLGGGWLGEVHIATDLDEGRELALRIINEGNSGQSFLIMQLERLLFKMQSLRHPNILEVEPLQQRDHQAFYAMALATKDSVRQLLQQQGRSGDGLPLVTTVEIGRQAAVSLAYAHDQGLMHGNLKPENVLLQPGRTLVGHTGYTVQLTDFGLAELRVGAYGTHDRAVVNTLSYTSPEQCKGIRNELKTDIYTLGLILYELVTGLVPFDIRDAEDAFEKHQHVAPRQPSQLRTDLPEDLEEVILTCLAKHPDDRYANAGELESALQSVLNKIMPSGPEPTIRLPTLPALPAAPKVEDQTTDQPHLLVFSEQHELLRDIPITEEQIQQGLTIGRAPGNAVILEHAGVSRYHLNVEFNAGKVYVTELTATNGTMMDGLPLSTMTRSLWPSNSLIYLRPYWLVLIGVAEQRAKPRIVVKPQKEHIVLEPGKPYELNVLLANTGKTVDHFQLSIDGIPPEWVQNPYGEVQLNPGTQGSSSLILLAPRDSTSLADTYESTVLARSREDTSQYGRAALTIEVAPFTEIVATITPAVRRTFRRANYTFKLENRSNIDGLYVPRLRETDGNVSLIPNVRNLVSLEQMSGAQGVAGLRMPRVVDPAQIARDAARQAQNQLFSQGSNILQRIIQGSGRVKIENLSAVILLRAGESVEEEMRAHVPIRWVGIGPDKEHNFTINVLDAAELDEDDRASPLTNAKAKLQHRAVMPMWLLLLIILLIGIFIWWITRPPKINEFKLVGSTVRPDQPFEVTWNTTNAWHLKIMELDEKGKKRELKLISDNLKRNDKMEIKGINENTTYIIEARNLIKTKRTKSLIVRPEFIKPQITIFDVTPRRVSGNGKVTIKWHVINAQKVEIDKLGEVPLKGSKTLKLSKDTTFRIEAKNGTASDNKSASVSVAGAQIKLFKVEPNKIIKGDTAKLWWKVEDATSISIEGIGTVPAQGSRKINPRQTTSYTLSATGANNNTKKTNTSIEVRSPLPKITFFKAGPNPARSNGKITVKWKTQNASNVTLQSHNGIQSVGPYGSITLEPPQTSANTTAELVLIAKNDDGEQVSKDTTVQVKYVDVEAIALAKQQAQIQAQQREEEAQRQEAERKAKAQQREQERKEKEAQARVQRQQRQAEQNATNSKTNEQLGLIKFTATPQEIKGKGNVALKWEAPGFKTVRIWPLQGPLLKGRFEAKGQKTIKNVNSSRTYTLVVDYFVWKNGKKVYRSIKLPRRIKVIPPPVEIYSFRSNTNYLNQPGPVTLSWEVKNAKAIRISGVPGPWKRGLWPAKGQTKVNVQKTTSYKLMVGKLHKKLRVEVAAAPPPPPPGLQYFTATPNNLDKPGKTTLKWWVKNAKTVKLDGLLGPNNDGSWPAQGNTQIQVNKSRNFVLRFGSLKAYAPVSVKPPPPKKPQIVYFSASPTSFRAGDKITLRWRVDNVQAINIKGIVGALPAKGEKVITLNDSQTFILQAGELSKELKLTMLEEPYAWTRGQWKHPFGEINITQVRGRRGKGTFIDSRDNIQLPIDISYSGDTFTAVSPNLSSLKLILSFSQGQKVMRGTYTLRGKRERWCIHRPNVEVPPNCR